MEAESLPDEYSTESSFDESMASNISIPNVSIAATANSHLYMPSFSSSSSDSDVNDLTFQSFHPTEFPTEASINDNLPLAALEAEIAN